ncbi:MAG: ATP-dependent zinc metalloprotease FtsH [Oscillospiraceae bacterium]|nr:ATP-dependent zinc metalloprotease FtsH [Oscillospiraceae bacterium]MBR6610204.1 ATP-dependent zinc metalloprotease FtsH [Oscillospiraceae bacterium]
MPMLALFTALLLGAILFSKPVSSTDMKTSEIIDLFRKQQVVEYTLNIGSGDIEIKTNSSEEPIYYRVPSVSYFVNKIDPYVEEYNKLHPAAPMVYNHITPVTFPSWVAAIPTVILIGLTLFMLMFLFNQQNGKGMSVGKAKTKDATDLKTRKTFKDVAGADEEKEELVEIVEFLKEPGKFNALGARIPKGVLLVGPPGTGKTLLAKATAGEAGVPFYSISGSDFIELYVGVGASRVRDLFEKAKKTAPAIIFIDEIDAVGRQRGAGLGGGQDEREQTLNQLLVEMDGFGANEGVIVMAATNRADILDKALLRAGRFDRQIYVGLPDVKGREEVLAVHFRGKPIGPDIDMKKIAQSTPGFTGADLENLVNEAALMAAKKGKKAITQAEIEAATIKVIAGPEKKSRVVTEKEKRLVSYHEAGHAIAHYFCPTADPVQEISIVPRGMAGGYTLSMPEQDSNYKTKTEMSEEIVTLLGGRCAEQLILDDISTGASNDLERVTAIAKAMVTRYGFSEKLGNVVYGGAPEQTFLGRDYTQGRGHSEAVANDIDVEVRRFVDEGYQKCMDILRSNEDKLHIVAKELMVKEKINGERFKQLMSPDYNPDEEVVAEEPAPVVAQQEETAETPVENTVVADVVETVEETTETPQENN